MQALLNKNKDRIIKKMQKITSEYKSECKEYKYKLNLLNNGIVKDTDSLGTKISKLYLVLNAVDAAEVINALGYRIRTDKAKGSCGERKYKALDITEIIDNISKDKTVDRVLKEKVIKHRKDNSKCGWS